MSDNEIHYKAIAAIWGWASYLYDGYAEGELSDHFKEEVDCERMTEQEALKCQEWCKHEADIILKRGRRIKRLNNNT